VPDGDRKAATAEPAGGSAMAAMSGAAMSGAAMSGAAMSGALGQAGPTPTFAR
jgi:hypothetical protein